MSFFSSFPSRTSAFSLVLALALALGGVVFAAACSETTPPELSGPPALVRFDKRPSNTTCLADTLPLGRVRLEPTFKGLEYPLAMVERPALGLVYVGEMPGRVKVIERATGKITTALDIVSKVSQPNQQGLFGMAVHPTKPLLYVLVERQRASDAKPEIPYVDDVLRFASTDGGKTFDPATETTVIRLERPDSLHPAGHLLFGPDGFLYVGVGEGARPYTPSSLLGVILRLDIDSAVPYAIPPGNPFASGGGRGEIWAGGFRNPWRFSFDRATGELWEADVGGGGWEEINVVEKGKNYGWPTLEGNTCFVPREGCDRTGLAPPVFVYPHSEGASVTGGYVYRGKAMPALFGKYVYADFTVGHVRMLEGSGESAKAVFLNPGGPKPLIASFGEDQDGELYALGWEDGVIYKLVPGEDQSRPVFPQKLSQTGCVDPANPKEVASGLVPYGVNVELWSDGAVKRRFVGIPDGTKIHVEGDGDFTLPDRSVVVKDFTIGGKRIETRLLRRHPGGEWTAASYEWNDAQTDATLQESAKDKVLANGKTYSIPSSIQCFVCHTKVAGISLGLETLQLNRDFAYAPGHNANQVTTLFDVGILDKSVDPTTAPRLPALTGAAPVEERARSYLHANCAMCHREGGGTGAVMDFSFSSPRSAIKGCTQTSFPGVGAAQVLTPGDPGQSAVYLRMATRTDYKMPPLATNEVDDVASAVMADWIRTLKTCE